MFGKKKKSKQNQIGDINNNQASEQFSIAEIKQFPKQPSTYGDKDLLALLTKGTDYSV